MNLPKFVNALMSSVRYLIEDEQRDSRFYKRGKYEIC